ncbi:hypothetical protein [Variovorax sp. Root411]|uniref:hypothetical protein n=1 Tax=Variovorax sp. Root411 TaxID=1736530 RepID=UPI0006F8237D|nr:hypothetical protein [Variovorax sp. Root411]KQW64903.1 hypothetical protein ASC92_05595 [Variovorax sp. Root411]
MMPTIFVLDVPEFLPLVMHAQEVSELAVTGPRLGYYRIQSQGTITLHRKALGFKPAVWHGALTGGLIGQVEHFDNDELRIGELHKS